jgi:hypothetical protein
MATLDSNISDDSKFFDLLFPLAHPDMSVSEIAWVREDLLLTGEIQIETVIENAVEKVGGPKKTSEAYMDHEDKSDTKKSCVRTRARGKEYSGPVSNIVTKVGTLRVTMYERKRDRFYFFVIPRRYYSGITYLEIPFTLSGIPKRNNHWWNHEVKDFQEVATKQ